MNKDIQYNNRFLETLVTSPFSSWINLTWDLESSDGGERLTSSCQLWVEVNNSFIKRALCLAHMPHCISPHCHLQAG